MRRGLTDIMLTIMTAMTCVMLWSCSPRRSGSGVHDVAGFADFEIIGIDVSAHNGDIDFDRVKAGGIEFVIIKATEGGTFKDRRFVDNIRNARKAGLKVGAYHFFRFDTPGYIQGLNFVNSIHGRDLDLPVVIDIEEYTNPNLQTTRLVMARVIEMADYMESHGYRVMLYTNKKGHSRFLKGRFEGYPLWICSLGSLPDDIDVTLWQATHHGKIDGIDTDVDVNVFPGSRDEWLEFSSGMQ